MTDQRSGPEVESHANKIVEHAQQAVAERRYDSHYAPFALFMAGVVSGHEAQKTVVLNLLTVIERENSDQNTAILRRFLQKVVDKQMANIRNGQCPYDVDWTEETRTSTSSLSLVMFGF